MKQGGIQKLGRFAAPESFLVIFLKVDPANGIKSALIPNSNNSLADIEQAVLQSDLQLTLSFKKGLTSVGTLLKSYSLAEAAK